MQALFVTVSAVLPIFGCAMARNSGSSPFRFGAIVYLAFAGTEDLAGHMPEFH